MGHILDTLLERYVAERLKTVGVALNGGEGLLRMDVHDPSVYRKVLMGGSLALGETYQRGLWDCDSIAELCAALRRLQVDGLMKLWNLPLILQASLLNMQTLMRSREVAERHYDISNEFYGAMLDQRYRQYSCAYLGRGAQTLEEAQEDKLLLIGEKLQLEPGMRVLDIGCGWGGLARFLAETYKVEVFGITLSVEQAEYARRHNAAEGVHIEVRDYRDVPEEWEGAFDRIVSVGMFEHVGPKNYDTFMQSCALYLKREGRMLLHSIMGRGRPERWINEYIFPNGVLPSRTQRDKAAERYFFLWDEHSFGKDYAQTLKWWHERFVASWPQFKDNPPDLKRGPTYGTKAYAQWFFRTWSYYLLMCAGAFQGGFIDLDQVILSPSPKPLGYKIVR